MTTWKAEMAVVCAVLATVVFVGRRDWTEWVGAAAVGFSFAHGQVAERLAEREATRDHVLVECHEMAKRYFVAKEACWFVYFVATRSYAALAGVVLFLAYPVWRRIYRARRPVGRPTYATAVAHEDKEK